MSATRGSRSAARARAGSRSATRSTGSGTHRADRAERHVGRDRLAGAYVELHAHSAYSFLDGASLPEELAARAAELGYDALALTDHDGVYGSLEFAHAAKHLGLRAITGAEVTLAGGAHVTLLVRDRSAATPTSAASSPTPTRARGRRGRRRAPPLPPQTSVDGSSPPTPTGLVCLSGCARSGLAVVDPNARRAARTRLPRRVLRRAPAPVRARRRAAERGARRPGGDASASRRSRPATCTRTTRAARASRTRSSRSATARRSTAASASGAATTRAVLRPPEEMLDRLPRDAALRTREVADRCAFDLTQELGYRYPDFSDGPEPGRRAAARDLRPRLRRPLRQRERPQASRARAARRGAGADRTARARRASSSCTGRCSSSRASARSRSAAPARRATRSRRAAAAARASARSSAT